MYPCTGTCAHKLSVSYTAAALTHTTRSQPPMTTHQVQIVSEVSLPFPRGHSQTRHRLSPSQQSHAFTGIYAHQVSAWSELTLPLRKFFLADIEEFRRRWTHCAKASNDGELRNTYCTLIAAPSCRLATGWVVLAKCVFPPRPPLQLYLSNQGADSSSLDTNLNPEP